MRATKMITVLTLISLLIGLAGCAPSATQAPAATPEPITLKVTVLRILEALPMYVAIQEGYFTSRGVKVEIVPAASAPERDQLIASGQVDGMVNELLGAILYDRQQTEVQVVRYSRTATAEAPLFRILASAKSGITSVDGLKGVPIGISTGTIIEYLTERLLLAEGFKPEEIKSVAVPGISDRLALLNSGELKAAMFPDPLNAVAMSQGAVAVIDNSKHPEYSFSVYTFRKTALDQHPEAIRAFLAGLEDATRKINADPGQWKKLLVEQKILPAPLEASFQVPKFATAGIPTRDQYKDILEWAKAKSLVDADVPYERTVNAAFLP